MNAPIILVPSIFTLIMIIIDIAFFKRRLGVRYYLTIFTATFILKYVSYSEAYEEHDYEIVRELEFCGSSRDVIEYIESIDIPILSYGGKTAAEIAVEQKKKAVDESILGTYCFHKACENCTLIPKKSDRELSKSLLEAALLGILTPGMKAKAVASVTLLLIEYSIHLYEVWWDVSANLSESRYHFLMAQFHLDEYEKYSNMVNNWQNDDGPKLPG